MSRQYFDFKSLFIDIKNFFVYTFNSIHGFLNQFLDDTVLGIILIVSLAFLIIYIFRQVSGK